MYIKLWSSNVRYSKILNDNLHVIKEELGKRHGKWNKENEDYIAI